jgi:hypothetical protein
MAFFSDGAATYFSLDIDPAGGKRCYVFRLTPTQDRLSRRFVEPAFAVALLTFLAAVAVLVFTALGFGGDLLLENNQDVVPVVVGSIATVSALSEVAFFLWIRSRRGALLDERERGRLGAIRILRRRSRLLYAIFLLDMTVPFLLLLAIPGGVLGLAHEIWRYGLGNVIFFVILLAAFTVIGIHLAQKIYCLGRDKPGARESPSP